MSQLCIRYSEVSVCSVNGYEIDFIVNGPTRPEYFLVSWNIDNPETRKRELRALT